MKLLFYGFGIHFLLVVISYILFPSPAMFLFLAIMFFNLVLLCMFASAAILGSETEEKERRETQKCAKKNSMSTDF